MARQIPVRRKMVYENWLEKEGIPIFDALAGVEDISELPRRPWARMGGHGTFIQLDGTKQAGKLLYVVEIPGGGALEPEKHLYDELIYILRGRGLSEVWHQGQGKHTFEWGEGSLFAVPLNAWHRLVNGGREPVLFFGVSNAPILMETLRNTEFIFNCDYNFTDRYSGQTDYFSMSEKRYKDGLMNMWETNFVPDVRTALLDNNFRKASGGQGTQFKMASWSRLHASEWPVGRYHKAHYHGPGAVILGLNGEGYALVWPKQYGVHPYQDGHGNKVIRVNWKAGGIYAPQNEWFHQHFNTGPQPARQLRVTGGGSEFGLPKSEVDQAVLISIRDGGWLVEYEDEDPEIRRTFKEELRKKGVEFTMPPVVYSTDPIGLTSQMV